MTLHIGLPGQNEDLELLVFSVETARQAGGKVELGEFFDVVFELDFSGLLSPERYARKAGLLSKLNVFVENFSIHPVVPESDLRLAVHPVNVHSKEAAFDLQILMHLGAVLLAESGGVLVGCRSTGILAHPGFGIARDILPVPVATDHEHVFLGGDELTQLVAFVSKSLIGVIIVLAAPVRSDHRSRADENPEGGI